MTRVLHLLPADCDLHFRRSFAALRDDPASCGHATRVIGRGGDYANLFWAIVGLRRTVKQFDAVHAWDERALTAATFAGAEKIVFTAPPSLSRRGRRVLQRAMTRAEVRIIAESSLQRAYYISVGLLADHCPVILPPAAALDGDQSRRQTMRKQLGIGDNDFVILAPAESTRGAKHERAVWIGSILHVVDERYRVLLWGRGNRLDGAVGLGHKLRQPGLVIAAEHALKRSIEFDDLLVAADTMLVPGKGPIHTIAVGLAMRAGLPVVASDNAQLSEILTDETTALKVPTNAPRPMAQRILDLRADLNLRNKTIAGAKIRADELFDPIRCAEQYRAVYACAAEPQPA